ncbi:MAG: HAD-IIB family hydrolase [bacterium]|nr:HAD-IIB family hydrolase [bacterium]
MQKPSVFIFDLDGTLAESKSKMGAEVDALLSKMLMDGKVLSIISGANRALLEHQFLSEFSCDKKHFHNLYLLPTCGAAFHRWHQPSNDWEIVYEHFIPEEKRKEVIRILEEEVFKLVSFEVPKETWGQRIEDRITQITCSMLGREAPHEHKKVWDPDKRKRTELANLVNERVEGLIARIGGSTTIDINMEGIDKAFGVNEFFKHTEHDRQNAIFFGDSLHEGGNDFPVSKTGIPCVAVEGPEDLLGKIERYL